MKFSLQIFTGHVFHLKLGVVADYTKIMYVKLCGIPVVGKYNSC